jgi:hypothetical protein
MKSGQESGNSLLRECEAWLHRAGTTRQLKVTDPSRTAQIILQHRQAEELMLRLIRWIAGYESEHQEISRLVVELHAASTPTQPEAHHRHWSITEEFPRGASGKFRAALNALFKHLKE